MSVKYRKDINAILPPSPVTCEVGVAEGLLSEHILQKWNPSKHIMVDLWGHIPNVTGDGNFAQTWHNKNYNEVIARTKPFENKIEILRGVSWNMAQLVPNESLDLCYLDAGHYYDAVLKDLVAWYPKVKKGAILAGHDYANKDYDVFEAVQEFIKGKGIEVILIPEDHWSMSGFYFYKP